MFAQVGDYTGTKIEVCVCVRVNEMEMISQVVTIKSRFR